jgi:tetratricopeptide (TPR) repeat protein
VTKQDDLLLEERKDGLEKTIVQWRVKCSELEEALQNEKRKGELALAKLEARLRKEARKQQGPMVGVEQLAALEMEAEKWKAEHAGLQVKLDAEEKLKKKQLALQEQQHAVLEADLLGAKKALDRQSKEFSKAKSKQEHAINLQTQQIEEKNQQIEDLESMAAIHEAQAQARERTPSTNRPDGRSDTEPQEEVFKPKPKLACKGTQTVEESPPPSPTPTPEPPPEEDPGPIDLEGGSMKIHTEELYRIGGGMTQVRKQSQAAVQYTPGAVAERIAKQMNEEKQKHAQKVSKLKHTLQTYKHALELTKKALEEEAKRSDDTMQSAVLLEREAANYRIKEASAQAQHYYSKLLNDQQVAFSHQIAVLKDRIAALNLAKTSDDGENVLHVLQTPQPPSPRQPNDKRPWSKESPRNNRYDALHEGIVYDVLHERPWSKESPQNNRSNVLPALVSSTFDNNGRKASISNSKAKGTIPPPPPFIHGNGRPARRTSLRVTQLPHFTDSIESTVEMIPLAVPKTHPKNDQSHQKPEVVVVMDENSPARNERSRREVKETKPEDKATPEEDPLDFDMESDGAGDQCAPPMENGLDSPAKDQSELLAATYLYLEDDMGADMDVKAVVASSAQAVVNSEGSNSDGAPQRCPSGLKHQTFALMDRHLRYALPVVCLYCCIYAFPKHRIE